MKCPKCQHENPEDSTFCGKCGTQITPAFTETIETSQEELATGSIFAGRYQVIEELGTGGMGKVYRVLDKKLNEEVALKLIRPEIVSDKRTLERFKNELKLARKVSQKNVGRMFDLGEETGSHYITMEYVPGEDLKSFIRRVGQIPVGKSISIAKQLCEGLSEAHEIGIVHRDLKPSNIMIDKQGNARIMDFGIARSLKGKGMTGAGVMIGTPEYMSPEQVEGKDADARSDIYSLGIILYEMLTGNLPFTGDTPFAVGVKQKSEVPKDPKELNPQIPDDLSAIILKCLAKEKEDRYSRADDVRSELVRIEQGLPATEHMPTRRKPLTSREITVKVNLKKIAVPGLVLIALVAAVVLLFIFIPKRRTLVGPKIENSIAVISFKNQTGDPAYDYLQEAIPNLLITNLENSGLFYVSTWERMKDILKQMGVKADGVISSDDGFALCQREGIQAVVIGAFSKAGDIFTTDVKIYDAETKRILKSANDKGSGIESIFDRQIDHLSREISLGLGAGLDKVENAQLNIKNITTHSPEAYKYFLKGKEACNLFYWEEAREHLERALEIDPAFAMAYVYLAWSYVDTGPLRTIIETIEKAMKIADKTSQKDRFYLDALSAYFVDRDAEKAVDLLAELTRKYPEEKWAFHMSGDFLRDDIDLERARTQYENWLALDPQDANAIYHLSWVFVLIGNPEKAEEHIRMHEAIASPEFGNISRQYTMYYRMGQVNKAMTKRKEAREIYPDLSDPISALSWLYALQEDYKEALKWANEYVSLASSPLQKMDAYLRRGYIHSLRGAFDNALADFSMTLQVGEEANNWRYKAEAQAGKGFVYLVRGNYELSRRSYEKMLAFIKEDDREAYPFFYYEPYRVRWAFCMGILALEQGQSEPANAMLSEIKSLLPEFLPSLVDFYRLLRDLLQGEMLLVQGDLDEALVAGQKVWVTESPYWLVNELFHGIDAYYLDLVARAYAKKGEVSQAIAEYERLFKMNVPNGYKYHVYPIFHYRLGLLYEKAGKAANAKAQLEMFLDLWKEADPGLPEAEDARKRLARLKGS